MAENPGFVFDTIDFDKRFQAIVRQTMPDLLGRGLFQAGSQLCRDAIKEKPRAPHRMGNLWRAQQVNKPIHAGQKITVDAGFNIEYAAYQHEGQRVDGTHVVERYSISRTERVPAGETDYGKKFLSKKQAANRNKYMKIAADYCRENAGK